MILEVASVVAIGTILSVSAKKLYNQYIIYKWNKSLEI